MELLQSGDVLFDRFLVESHLDSGGQSFGFKGTDIKADRSWQKPVFIKQYHDLVPRSAESAALGPHFRSLNQKLADKAHYLCLPVHVGEASNSVIAIFPFVDGKSLRELLDEGIPQARCVRFAQAIT